MNNVVNPDDRAERKDHDDPSEANDPYDRMAKFAGGQICWGDGGAGSWAAKRTPAANSSQIAKFVGFPAGPTPRR